VGNPDLDWMADSGDESERDPYLDWMAYSGEEIVWGPDPD
jgi:hypothetical protein